MAKTQIKGKDIGDKTVTELDIDISGATSKSIIVSGDSLFLFDSDVNLSGRVTISNLETYFNKKYFPSANKISFATGIGTYAQVTTTATGLGLLSNDQDLMSTSSPTFNNLVVTKLNNLTVGGNGLGHSWSNIPSVASDGTMEIGKYIDFHDTSNDGVDYSNRIGSNGTSGLNISYGVTTGTYIANSVLNNTQPVSQTAKFDGFGIIGNRPVFYLTNSGTIVLGINTIHGGGTVLTVDTTGISVTGIITGTGIVKGSQIQSTVTTASTLAPLIVASTVMVANLQSQWTADLKDGLGGQIPYQTGADATSFLANGTPMQVLTSQGGTLAPIWKTLDMTYLPDSTFKKSVRCGTIVNITLTNVQTIDGITVVVGDRVLVKNQTLSQNNGIYTVAVAAWTRSIDADTITKIAGALVNIDSGTQKGEMWSNDISITDTLGTTTMNWYAVANSDNVMTFKNKTFDTSLTVNNTTGGDVSLYLNRGASGDCRVRYSSGGALHIESDWTTSKVAYYDIMSLNFNTGNMIVLGNVTAPTFIGAITGHASLDLPLTGGTITGSLTVNGSITGVKREINHVTTNLGTPSIEEIAALQGEFSNKFRFKPPTIQEESVDGVTWTTSIKASTNVLADMMIGNGQIGVGTVVISPPVAIGNSYRLTWDNDIYTTYVFLSSFYAYCSTNGNNVNFIIEAEHNTNGWGIICSGVTNNWPGHIYIPHTSLTFNSTATSYGKVRITFSITSIPYPNNSFQLYSMEWLGGYPAGQRAAETYDRDKNVKFPAIITGTQLSSTVTTASTLPPLTVVSTVMVNNLNSQYLNGQLGTYYQSKITGLTTNYVPKWNGSNLINGSIIDDGNGNVVFGKNSLGTSIPFNMISGPGFGGAIQFGTDSYTYNRGLNLGIIDNNYLFTPIISIPEQTRNVLIGTTADNGCKLQIGNSTNPLLSIGVNYSDDCRIKFTDSGTPWWTVGRKASQGDFSFSSYAKDEAVKIIATNGNVLIGSTTDNGAKLQVKGANEVLALIGDGAGCNINLFSTNAGITAAPLHSGFNYYNYAGTISGKLSFLDYSSNTNGTSFEIQTKDVNSVMQSRVFIGYNGNVLIGTTTDNTIDKLQVAGQISVLTDPTDLLQVSTKQYTDAGDLLIETPDDNSIIVLWANNWFLYSGYFTIASPSNNYCIYYGSDPSLVDYISIPMSSIFTIDNNVKPVLTTTQPIWDFTASIGSGSGGPVVIFTCNMVGPSLTPPESAMGALSIDYLKIGRLLDTITIKSGKTITQSSIENLQTTISTLTTSISLKQDKQFYNLVINKIDLVWENGWIKISNAAFASWYKITDVILKCDFGKGVVELNSIISYPSSQTYNGTRFLGFYVTDSDGNLREDMDFSTISLSYNMSATTDSKYNFQKHILGENVVLDESNASHSNTSKITFNAIFSAFSGSVIESVLDPLTNYSHVADQFTPTYLTVKNANLISCPYASSARSEESGSNSDVLTVVSHYDNPFQRIDITNSASIFLKNTICVGSRPDDITSTIGCTSYGYGMEFFEKGNNTDMSHDYPAKIADVTIGNTARTSGKVVSESSGAQDFSTIFRPNDIIIVNGERKTVVSVTVLTVTVDSNFSQNYTTDKSYGIFADLGQLWQNRFTNTVYAQSPVCAMVSAKLKHIKQSTGTNWSIVRKAARATATKDNGVTIGSWDMYRGFGIIDVDAAIAYINTNYKSDSYRSMLADQLEGTKAISTFLTYDDLLPNSPLSKKLAETNFLSYNGGILTGDLSITGYMTNLYFKSDIGSSSTLNFGTSDMTKAFIYYDDISTELGLASNNVITLAAITTTINSSNTIINGVTTINSNSLTLTGSASTSVKNSILNVNSTALAYSSLFMKCGTSGSGFEIQKYNSANSLYPYGTGLTNYDAGALWLGTSNVQRFFILSSGQIGIGFSSPVGNVNITQNQLAINGSLYATGFKLPTGANAGYYLKSDSSGNATWSALSSGYHGTWNANGNVPTLLAGTGIAGDWYRCTTPGSSNPFGTFAIGDDIYYSGSTWQKIPGGVALPVATSSVLGGVIVNNTYGVGMSGSYLSVLYGNTGTTSCVGNDSRLSDARPASDVQSWAKGSLVTPTQIGAVPLNGALGTPTSGNLTNCILTSTQIQNALTGIITTHTHNYVPYSGATSSINLGSWGITASDFSLSSDRRLKTNIKHVNLIDSDIKYMEFEMISNPGKKRYGVIAQELMLTNPELVNTDNQYLSVNYIDLIMKELAYLKNKVKELEGK